MVPVARGQHERTPARADSLLVCDSQLMHLTSPHSLGFALVPLNAQMWLVVAVSPAPPRTPTVARQRGHISERCAVNRTLLRKGAGPTPFSFFFTLHPELLVSFLHHSRRPQKCLLIALVSVTCSTHRIRSSEAYDCASPSSGFNTRQNRQQRLQACIPGTRRTASAARYLVLLARKFSCLPLVPAAYL